MIEKCTGYTSDGEDFHATLEEAQLASLRNLFEKDENASGDKCQALAQFTFDNAEEFLEILATKHRGRPRNTKGATKMRKAKPATAALPLGEKEGA